MIKALLKAYFTITGWFKVQKMTHGNYYRTKTLPDRRYMYNKGREFFFAEEKTVPGAPVTFFNQDRLTFKYWEIGILGFKEA